MTRSFHLVLCVFLLALINYVQSKEQVDYKTLNTFQFEKNVMDLHEKYTKDN